MSLSTEDLDALLSGRVSLPNDFDARANEVDQQLAALNAAPTFSTMFTNDSIQKAESDKIGQRVVEIPSYVAPTPAPVYASKDVPGAIQGAYTSVHNIIKSLNEESDYVKKQQILVDLQASTGALLAQEQKKAREQAEQELGVKGLRDTLKQNEQLDRQDPKWAQFQSDSKVTSGIRQRLMQSEASVDRTAMNLLKENIELARLAKTIDGVIDFHSKDIAKKSAKADIKQENISTLVSTILPEVRRSFNLDNPALVSDQAFGEYILQAAKGGKDRDSIDALMTGAVRPDNYLVAGLAGNTIALRLAAAEQADRTGLDRTTVESQLIKAAKIVRDPEAFLAAAPALGMKKKDIDQLRSELLIGGKEAKAKLAEVALSKADDYLAAIQTASINGDILGWKKAAGETSVDQLPGAAPIIQDLQQKRGNSKIDIESFASAYLGQPGISKEEKFQRQQLLGDKYSTTLERARSGLYGREIDTVGLTNRLLTRTTLSLTDQGFGGGMQAAGSGLLDVLSGRGNLQYGVR